MRAACFRLYCQPDIRCFSAKCRGFTSGLRRTWGFLLRFLQWRSSFTIWQKGNFSVAFAKLHQASRFLESPPWGFQTYVPQARQWRRRHGLRDLWQAMLHLRLGANAPQAAAPTSALGRAERSLIIDCMAAMVATTRAPSESPTRIPASTRGRGVLQRVRDYFF